MDSQPCCCCISSVYIVCTGRTDAARCWLVPSLWRAVLTAPLFVLCRAGGCGRRRVPPGCLHRRSRAAGEALTALLLCPCCQSRLQTRPDASRLLLSAWLVCRAVSVLALCDLAPRLLSPPGAAGQVRSRERRRPGGATPRGGQLVSTPEGKRFVPGQAVPQPGSMFALPLTKHTAGVMAEWCIRPVCHVIPACRRVQGAR